MRIIIGDGARCTVRDHDRIETTFAREKKGRKRTNSRLCVAIALGEGGNAFHAFIVTNNVIKPFPFDRPGRWRL